MIQALVQSIIWRAQKMAWQPGGFDRLLRMSESIHEKWNYIRENPVRAGLVAHWKEWRYQKGFADHE
jgi:REP-associated tyrosine transposase